MTSVDTVIGLQELHLQQSIGLALVMAVAGYNGSIRPAVSQHHAENGEGGRLRPPSMLAFSGSEAPVVPGSAGSPYRGSAQEGGFMAHRQPTKAEALHWKGAEKSRRYFIPRS